MSNIDINKLTSKNRQPLYQSNPIDLILAPWGFGGTDNLSQEGAHFYLEKELDKRLKAIGNEVQVIEPESLGPFQMSEDPERIRNIETIAQINSWLSKRVEQSAREGRIPVVMGGDTSLSIASIAGLVNAGKDIGVIWLSNHFCNSTPEVTKSWNANRMAFSAISYEGNGSIHSDFDKLLSVSNKRPMISKDKIIHIGITHRSAQDSIEHDYFSMETINEIGSKDVLDIAVEILEEKCKQIHIIVDVNAFDLSGVSNFSLGQMMYREALIVAREIDLKIRRAGKLSSIDMVEYCPSREAWNKKGEAAEWMNDIVGNIFGETVLNCLGKKLY